MIKVKRNDFLNALRLVKPGAGRKTDNIPHDPFHLVLFDKGWIRTMNETLSVSCKFETGIQGGLPFDHLYTALKMMKSDDLSISSDKSQAVFRCGFSEIALNLIDGNTLSDSTLSGFNMKEAINLDDMKWQPAPKNLLDGLKLSLLSAEDTDFGRLAGIVITENLILSCDNYRISMYEMDDRLAGELIRIRTSTVKVLIKMKESYEHVSASEKWLHLKNDSLVVSLKQLPIVDYPLDDVLNAFNAKYHPEVYKLPTNLGQYIDRAEVLAGIGEGEMSFSAQISFKSEDGKLVITGKNGAGSLSSKIPWSGIMPKLTIDPHTLRELLKLTQSFKIGTDRQFVEFQIPNFKFVMIGMAEQVQEQVKQTKLEQLKALQQKN